MTGRMSMFIVFLRFSDSKSQAGEFMEGHNAWIKSGFDDGVFLVAGSQVRVAASSRRML